MRFPLIGSPNNNLSNTTPAAWMTICGNASWTTTNTASRMQVPVDCTIRRLLFLANAAPGLGKSYMAFLYVNGVAVEATKVEIPGELSTGEWKGTLSLAAGDLLSIEVRQAGEPATLGAGTVFLAEVETVGSVSFWGGSSGTNMATAGNQFQFPFSHTPNAPSTTEGFQRMIVPVKCKLKAFWASLSGTAGTAKSYTLFIRINNTTDVLELKIEGTVQTADSETGNVQLEAGDRIEIKIVPAGTPTARSIRSWGISVDTEGVAVAFHAGRWTEPESSSATNVARPSAFNAGTWGTGSANRMGYPPDITLANLRAIRSVAPGPGKKTTYGLTHLGVATSLSAPVNEGATTGADTEHTYVTVADTLNSARIAFASVPTSEPALDTGGVTWSFTISIPQPAAGRSRRSMVV